MEHRPRCGFALAALCLVVSTATRSFVDARQLRRDDDASDQVTLDTSVVPGRGGHAVTNADANSFFTVDPFLLVGGQTGQSAFFWNPDEGGLMERLDVWVGDWGVQGVKVTLSTGDEQMFGHGYGQQSVLELAPGEKITAASLWDNGLSEPRTRFGAIRLATDRNNSFEAGLPRYKRGPEHSLTLGSGLVVAAAGRTGADVVAFGLCFVREIASAVLEVKEYPSLQKLSPAGGQLTAVLAYVTYNNFGDSAQRVRMSGSPSVTARHSWDLDFVHWLSVPVPVKAGVPRVVDANGIPTNWTVSETSTWDETDTEEDVTRVYDLPLTVPPHTSVEAKATLAKLDVDVGFKCSVTVTCDNGAVWRLGSVGRYKGLAYAVTVTLAKNATIGSIGNIGNVGNIGNIRTVGNVGSVGSVAAEPRVASERMRDPVYVV